MADISCHVMQRISNPIIVLLSSVKRHPMTWRATSTWPSTEEAEEAAMETGKGGGGGGGGSGGGGALLPATVAGAYTRSDFSST